MRNSDTCKGEEKVGTTKQGGLEHIGAAGNCAVTPRNRFFRKP